MFAPETGFTSTGKPFKGDGFNEAGACLPRKHFDGGAVYSAARSFNEAGACLPRKRLKNWDAVGANLELQ